MNRAWHMRGPWLAGALGFALVGMAGGASAQPLLPLHTGDINNDGLRNVADVNCYVQAAIASTQALGQPTCQAFPDADVDLQCDGIINVLDVQRSVLLALWSLNPSIELESLLRVKDMDFDLVHDDCDEDTDGDGFPNACEIEFGTDPFDPTDFPDDPNACGCPGGCVIAGGCFSAGAVNPSNPCQACDPDLDPEGWSANDGGACESDDLCFGSGTCMGGACDAEPIDCDDGDVCTDNACDPQVGCVAQFNTAPCDDGDVCTTNSQCMAGECVGEPVTCDDGNACTEGACVAGSGCQFTPITCDDGIACTADSCDPAMGCVHTPQDALCDDGNVCTDDICDPAAGCVATNNTAACDDGDACTTNTQCSGGVCVGEAVTCDDGDACTSGACVTGVGCQFTPISCDDGIACTADSCSSATGCVHTPDDGLCDDGNGCTDDLCDVNTGCQNPANTAPCDDGNACTLTDVCSGGVCVGSNPLQCPSDLHPDCDAGVCDPATGSCAVADGTLCDDGDVCSVLDACVAGQCEAEELPCEVALCVIAGSAGETVNCAFDLATTSPAFSPAVGIQFKLVYDESRITLQTFEDGDFCPFPGAPPEDCFPRTIPVPFTTFSGGHGINLVPPTLPEWDQPGAAREALIINISDPTPLSTGLATPMGDLIDGDPKMMGMVFTLDVDISEDDPVIVDVLNVVATDSAATSLEVGVMGFMVLTGDSAPTEP